MTAAAVAEEMMLDFMAGLPDGDSGLMAAHAVEARKQHVLRQVEAKEAAKAVKEEKWVLHRGAMLRQRKEDRESEASIWSARLKWAGLSWRSQSFEAKRFHAALRWSRRVEEARGTEPSQVAVRVRICMYLQRRSARLWRRQYPCWTSAQVSP